MDMFLTALLLFLTCSVAVGIGLAKVMYRMSGQLLPGDPVKVGAAGGEPG